MRVPALLYVENQRLTRRTGDIQFLKGLTGYRSRVHEKITQNITN
jgi:hypothetical protein